MMYVAVWVLRPHVVSNCWAPWDTLLAVGFKLQVSEFLFQNGACK